MRKYLLLLLISFPLICSGVENNTIEEAGEDDYFYIRVKINGLNKELTKSVSSLIDFSQFNYLSTINVSELQDNFDETEILIKRFLHSQGYYQVKLKSTLTKNYTTWTANYSVILGSQVKINYVNINVYGPGKNHKLIKKYLGEIIIKSGDGFVHSNYEDVKTNLLKLITASGYLDAKYTHHEVAVDLKLHTADISLILNTGEQFYFGPISIAENRIDPNLIQRFIILREGEPYSSINILEQQNALGDSDYYSEILIKPRRNLTQNNRIPIEITTILRKPSKYSLGIGYTSDAGLKGSIAWSRRRLNNQGHRLFVGAAASKLGGSVGVRYRIPFRNPRYDEYVITTNYIQANTDTSKSKIGQLGIAQSILRNEWREILALDFQREIYSVAQQNDESVNLFLPNATWSWVVPRGELYISEGHTLSVTVRGSSKAIISSSNFIQSDINAKWIAPLSSRGRVIARARIGVSDVNDITDLPASFRYFTGGDQSIRGYSFASLGPENAKGEVTGGKHLLIGSLEFDFRIKGDWSVAAFFDVGNAFNDIDNVNAAQGVGLGIRWKTIVGQIRLDFATAITEPDNPKRLHLSIGPDF